MAIWKRHHGASRLKSKKEKIGAAKADEDEEENLAAVVPGVHITDSKEGQGGGKYSCLSILKSVIASWRVARKKFEAAWDRIEGRNSYVSYMTYASFLTSSMLFCIGHGLAIITPKDSLLALKRKIALLAMAMLIASYCFTIVLSSSPSLCKSEGTDTCKRLESVEYITSMVEAIFSLALACIATKFMVENDREPFFIFLGYCMCSLFSISSSFATICKIFKLPHDKRPDNHRVRVAMRCLSILLSTTNICMCLLSILGPKVDAPDYMRSSIKLATNMGWIVVFSGALLLLRVGQLRMESTEHALQYAPQDRKEIKAMLVKDIQCSPGLDVSIGGLAITEHIG